MIKEENPRDEVLKRMLKTPPKKHEPLGKKPKPSLDKEATISIKKPESQNR